MKKPKLVTPEIAAPAEAKTAARDRVKKHREMLRARGLRPIQLWISDTRRLGFQEEIDRQCQAINESAGEQEALDFIEHAMDYSGWV